MKFGGGDVKIFPLKPRNPLPSGIFEGVEREAGNESGINSDKNMKSGSQRGSESVLPIGVFPVPLPFTRRATGENWIKHVQHPYE